ncbi:DUF362 domain-containing protein [Natranaerobius thermophilus]|uniref:DUF362 domain-containing protein n=1 Tax=Natranaerobius thermophilus (strain ATCC BAA-1301 / DSM 18059 / JW/NM-WN-LF) TaxID=457570 RepID=B2A5X2_NATTJ|nr:DUF362 domain-containing protein [Natranaerobius thermophilus]ACB84065.1 protein of unknown function DUF362 [Natranaerobius thermophilus JW/NM-WN-LF]
MNKINSQAIYISYGDDPKSMVKELFDKYPPFPELNYNAKIGLKPNLVLPNSSESGATTSPELVSGIVEHFLSRGFKKLIIMESSWVGASTEASFEKCGYTAISNRYNLPLVDLKTVPTKAITFKDHTIKIATPPLQVDRLVNVPVLKAHCQTDVTCALKNLKGCLPDSEKRNFHIQGLDHYIATLNQILFPDLTIVDAILGDLTFEEGGNPVNMGRILMGTDPVLIDSYGAHLLGYSSDKLPSHIELAGQSGVGSVYHPEKHEIVELNRNRRQMDFFRTRGPFLNELKSYLEEDMACSPCTGSVYQALMRLKDEGSLKKLKVKIALGQGVNKWTRDYIEGHLGVGECTRHCSDYVSGCPPRADKILSMLKNYL